MSPHPTTSTRKQYFDPRDLSTWVQKYIDKTELNRIQDSPYFRTPQQAPYKFSPEGFVGFNVHLHEVYLAQYPSSNIQEKLENSSIKKHLLQSNILYAIARYAERENMTYEEMLERVVTLMIETQDEVYHDRIVERLTTTFTPNELGYSGYRMPQPPIKCPTIL